MKIKLCGMMRECDIEYANRVMPDYVGFVFADTRRYIDREKAATFKAKLNPGIKAVGVYVDDPPERVASDYQKGIIDIAQLHGNEDAEYIRRLKETAPGLELIKAVRVRNTGDVEKSQDIAADYLLYDAYVKGVPGGSGERFNWELLKDVKRPFFLAGGINESNILAAAEATEAFGLDLSSGIETEGNKDFDKMLGVTLLTRRCRPKLSCGANAAAN